MTILATSGNTGLLNSMLKIIFKVLANMLDLPLGEDVWDHQKILIVRNDLLDEMLVDKR